MGAKFVIPKAVYTGADALSAAKGEFEGADRKAFIVSGRHVAASGAVDPVTDLLDGLAIGHTLFTGITGEPTDAMIQAGVDAYNEEGCDFLIGIGGGSPLDAMKAIAASLGNPGPLTGYMGKAITGCGPKMIAIPTTAGTGSEATWFTIITDTEKDVKMLLKGPALMPDAAIVDYRLTLSSPPSVTASTGLDALTHVVEGYTSRRAQPLTDTLAISAVKRIFANLPRAYQNGGDTEAREQMALAALEGGMVITNSSVTLVHGMSRPIGALFHVPHGLSNAMLLTPCLTFAAEGAPGRFARLGREIGAAQASDADEDAAAKFIQAVDGLCRTCEIPTPEGYGIRREDFTAVIGKMAEDAAASGSPANTRRAVSVADMEAIYRKLY